MTKLDQLTKSIQAIEERWSKFRPLNNSDPLFWKYKVDCVLLTHLREEIKKIPADQCQLVANLIFG
jgi:hypothetical protein